MLPEDTTLEIFDVSSFPLYSQDSDRNPPEIIREFKQKIKATDAILIASPEHNYSITAVLKNAIEWGNRPSGNVTLRRYGASLARNPAPLPGETPIAARRTLGEVRFLLAKIVEGEVHVQRVAQECFRRGLRRGTFEAGARRIFLKLMGVADDAAGGIDTHVEFFFVQGTEKSRLPIPDVDIVRHHLIGLLEPYLSLEVRFRGIVHVKNDARIVPAELRALRGRELLCDAKGVRAGHLELDGGFGEGPEEIRVRHARAENASKNPDQENFCVIPVKPFQRQARLLLRTHSQSIFSHAAGDCKAFDAAR